MDKFLKKSDQHLVVKENVPNQRKGTKRKFKEEYIEYGFIASGPEDAQIPYCLICNSALSNESLVPNKFSPNSVMPWIPTSNLCFTTPKFAGCRKEKF